MVPKLANQQAANAQRFRAVLFRMVPKLTNLDESTGLGFRAVLFRMVPKLSIASVPLRSVLELCCFEWFQNQFRHRFVAGCFRAVLFRMVPKRF